MSDALLTLIAGLSSEKRAILARLLRPERDPIAIIGMGCRLPAHVHSPAAYWDLLAAGRDAVTEVPSERWDASAFAEKPNSRYGAFLDDIDRFDAPFFHIAAREAVRLDPQQRLVLEVAWEALEDAGQPREGLARTRTGVFVGVGSNEYAWRSMDLANLDAYCATGTPVSFVAGRLAFVLDLRGPALSIDTACSSSLVAVHLACQSLIADECDLAVAGGVNVILLPVGAILLGRGGAGAADGHCKTFDARADGYVRGEGCGIVVLKRLPEALADGDPIRAVILGSAVNQDGRTAGLTAPNPEAQERVLKDALATARLQPDAVGYVEAHGTGTSLGDPIELQALRAVLGRPRPDGSVCRVGSVKTNLGHLEAAAGIAGLMKVVLSLEHEAIPPHLHLRTPNPHCPLDGTALAIPTELTSWPRGNGPRIAGVSAFGASGTNAHVIVAEAPVAATMTRDPSCGTARSSSSCPVTRPGRCARRRVACRPSSTAPAARPSCLTSVTRRRSVARTTIAASPSWVAHTPSLPSALARLQRARPGPGCRAGPSSPRDRASSLSCSRGTARTGLVWAETSSRARPFSGTRSTAATSRSEPTHRGRCGTSSSRRSHAPASAKPTRST